MTSLRILVAEDDAMIALFLADLLTTMGHTVCATVETEQEAVSAAACYRPDLMIVDANLHDGNGVAAVMAILRSGFVPHIFVTGDPYSLEGLCSDAIVVEKPFMRDELARAIQRSCGPVLAKGIS